MNQTLYPTYSTQTHLEQMALRRPNTTLCTIEGGHVVHIDNPTVTLCIRTCNDITIPQWHHFENGLSILKRELDESVYKKLFYFDYCLTKHPTKKKLNCK